MRQVETIDFGMSLDKTIDCKQAPKWGLGVMPYYVEQRLARSFTLGAGLKSPVLPILGLAEIVSSHQSFVKPRS